jgi:hypothetical protein
MIGCDHPAGAHQERTMGGKMVRHGWMAPCLLNAGACPVTGHLHGLIRLILNPKLSDSPFEDINRS